MSSGRETYSTEPVFRVTPRHPLRQEMTLLQNAKEPDGVEEGPINDASSPSIWEQAASQSRHYLLIPPTCKIAYYIITLLLLSTIQYYVDLPHIPAITGKHSILNQVFVKKAWGFTLSVFILYRTVSLFLRPKLRVDLKQLVVRSAVTTFFFYFWCQMIFPVIDNMTSTCIAGNETLEMSKSECLKKEGQEYHSFDISGHTFLLTFSVLVMMEESKEIRYFLWLGRLLFGETTQDRIEANTFPNLDEKEVKSMRRRFPWLSPFVAVSFLSMCALALLWDFMIVVTTLYYHTFAEKVIGTVLALFTWGLIYRAALPRLYRWNTIES